MSHHGEIRGPDTCAVCEQLRRRIAELKAQLAAARKHSGNSSKPPSSDILKPLKAAGKEQKRQRRCGGQAGHRRRERTPFPAEYVTQTHDYTVRCCPACGGALSQADEVPRIVRQVEIHEVPIEIEEHRGLAYACAQCERVH